MKKILVIPDSHSKPGVSNERFGWLGEFIVEHKPDIVVNLGDAADMPSLSLFDVGKKSFEGRKYSDDIEAVLDAQEQMFKPIERHNQTLREKKVKLYKPRLVLTLGNHENRINRAIDSDRKLEGTISITDLGYQDFGWEVYPYKDIVDVEGIFFSHYFTKGLMDRPISGTTATLGSNILNAMKDNALGGHTHLVSLANASLASGRKIFGGSAGCYFEHREDYVSLRAQQEWTRGLLLLDRVEDKEVKDYSWHSLESIKKRYS